MWGCVFSVYPFPLWWLIEYIYIRCLIIIIKSEVWTITHYLGLGHETMVCAVCLSIFLFTVWKFGYDSSPIGYSLCLLWDHLSLFYTYNTPCHWKVTQIPTPDFFFHAQNIILWSPLEFFFLNWCKYKTLMVIFKQTVKSETSYTWAFRQASHIIPLINWYKQKGASRWLKNPAPKYNRKVYSNDQEQHTTMMTSIISDQYVNLYRQSSNFMRWWAPCTVKPVRNDHL